MFKSWSCSVFHRGSLNPLLALWLFCFCLLSYLQGSETFKGKKKKEQAPVFLSMPVSHQTEFLLLVLMMKWLSFHTLSCCTVLQCLKKAEQKKKKDQESRRQLHLHQSGHSLRQGLQVWWDTSHTSKVVWCYGFKSLDVSGYIPQVLWNITHLSHLQTNK